MRPASGGPPSRTRRSTPSSTRCWRPTSTSPKRWPEYSRPGPRRGSRAPPCFPPSRPAPPSATRTTRPTPASASSSAKSRATACPASSSPSASASKPGRWASTSRTNWISGDAPATTRGPPGRSTWRRSRTTTRRASACCPRPSRPTSKSPTCAGAKPSPARRSTSSWNVRSSRRPATTAGWSLPSNSTRFARNFETRRPPFLSWRASWSTPKGGWPFWWAASARSSTRSSPIRWHRCRRAIPSPRGCRPTSWFSGRTCARRVCGSRLPGSASAPAAPRGSPPCRSQARSGCSPRTPTGSSTSTSGSATCSATSPLRSSKGGASETTSPSRTPASAKRPPRTAAPW